MQRVSPEYMEKMCCGGGGYQNVPIVPNAALLEANNCKRTFVTAIGFWLCRLKAGGDSVFHRAACRACWRCIQGTLLGYTLIVLVHSPPVIKQTFKITGLSLPPYLRWVRSLDWPEVPKTNRYLSIRSCPFYLDYCYRAPILLTDEHSSNSIRVERYSVIPRNHSCSCPFSSCEQVSSKSHWALIPRRTPASQSPDLTKAPKARNQNRNHGGEQSRRSSFLVCVRCHHGLGSQWSKATDAHFPNKHTTSDYKNGKE